MTAPRISSRTGRNRFFIGLATLILMVGFVAIFHSSQQQLDESRQLRVRCEQQQEALNARMQAIVEHKFRLEKSLESERKEHLETKQTFEVKNKEQKDIHEKATLDSSVRFDSLQQHFKLLQSEHNDLVEDCAKTKETQLEDINGLERKLKNLQNQLQQSKSQRDKDVEHWKAKYETLQTEKKHLEQQTYRLKQSRDQDRKVKNLEKEIERYRLHCKYHPENDIEVEDNLVQSRAEPHTRGIEKSFNEQVPVSEDLYKISIKITNNTYKMHETNNKTMVDGFKYSGNRLKNMRDGSVINSVENFQMIPKPLVNSDDQTSNNRGDNGDVLQQPPPLKNPNKSSTLSTADRKTPDNLNKQILPFVSVPSATSEKIKRSSTHANDRKKELSGRSRSRPIPLGVAPVPENFDALIRNEETNLAAPSGNANMISNNNNNNRYANVVDEISGKKVDTEQENVGHEIRDNDINGIDEKNEPKDHLQEVLDNMNNAAEDDTNNLYDAKVIGPLNKKNGNEDDDDVEMVGNKHERGLMEGDEKLINEVVGDQGKEPAFPDGMHIEEPNEEDEDEDDYSNPAARQQEGPAVRN